MKLHTGCSSKYIEGWEHLDAMEYAHVDYIAKADNLYMISDNSVGFSGQSLGIFWE